jgi:hypothetical protein
MSVAVAFAKDMVARARLPYLWPPSSSPNHSSLPIPLRRLDTLERQTPAAGSSAVVVAASYNFYVPPCCLEWFAKGSSSIAVGSSMPMEWERRRVRRQTRFRVGAAFPLEVHAPTPPPSTHWASLLHLQSPYSVLLEAPVVIGFPAPSGGRSTGGNTTGWPRRLHLATPSIPG